MKTRIQLLFALALLMASAPVWTSQAPAGDDRAASLKAALAENQAALRAYTWVETTDVSLKGEVKKHEQKQCYYGADGKVQKTPIAGAAPKPASPPPSGGRRGGRVKQNIVENKVDEMKEYMASVAALVHQYVPPDPKKIQAAQAAGTVTTAPSGGVLSLTVKDYVKPGDALAIGFDTAAKKLTSYRVTPYVEKPKEDDVTLAVQFGRLEDGTAYPQQTVMDVTAKKIVVKITNSGYKKAGS